MRMPEPAVCDETSKHLPAETVSTGPMPLSVSRPASVSLPGGPTWSLKSFGVGGCLGLDLTFLLTRGPTWFFP